MKNVLLVVLVIIMTACNRNNDKVSNQLNSAEYYMETRPDTALSIIESIPDPETLTGETQARYALLKTQALHKNYYEFDSDSLIFIALNYYKDKEDAVSKAKSYLYYGKYLKELGFNEDAQKNFQEAINLLESTDEYKLLGLTYEEIASWEFRLELYIQAISNFKKSLKYFYEVGDSMSMCNAYKNIGMAFTHIGNADSSLYYYGKAYEIALIKNSKYKTRLLQNIGVVYRGMGDYDQAEHYVRLSMDNGGEEYSCSISLGYIYYLKGEYDKAEPFFLKNTHSSDDKQKADAYESLFKIARDRGKYKEAILYKEKVDSLLTGYHDKRTENITKMAEVSRSLLQARYDKENLKKENRIMYLVIAVVAVALLLAIGAIVALSVFNRMWNEKKIQKRMVEEMRNTVDNITTEVAGNKLLIFKYEKQNIELINKNAELKEKNTELKDKNNELIDKNLKEISDLNSRVDLLTEQKTALQNRMENHKSMEAFGPNSMIEIYVNGLLVFYKMLEVSPRYKVEEKKEEEDLLCFFDFVLNGFVTRFNQETAFKCTNHEIELACLIRIGFSNSQIGKIFNSQPDSISRAKNRLKSRLSTSVDVIIDQYLKSL